MRSYPDGRPCRSVSLAIHRQDRPDQEPDDPEDPDDPDELDDPEEPLEPDESEPLLVVEGALLPESLAGLPPSFDPLLPSFDPLLESFDPPSVLDSLELLPLPVLLDEPLRLSVR